LGELLVLSITQGWHAKLNALVSQEQHTTYASSRGAGRFSVSTFSLAASGTMERASREESTASIASTVYKYG
jgi:hypothetical protein